MRFSGWFASRIAAVALERRERGVSRGDAHHDVRPAAEFFLNTLSSSLPQAVMSRLIQSRLTFGPAGGRCGGGGGGGANEGNPRPVPSPGRARFTGVADPSVPSR